MVLAICFDMGSDEGGLRQSLKKSPDEYVPVEALPLSLTSPLALEDLFQMFQALLSKSFQSARISGTTATSLQARREALNREYSNKPDEH